MPLKKGDTFFPTSRPTTVPTLNLYDYPNSAFYALYQADILESIASGLGALSVQYATIDYKGLRVDGTCSEWSTFTADQLDLPFPGVHFSKVTVRYGWTKFQTGTAKNTTWVCSVQSAVASIVKALRSGQETIVLCGKDRWVLNGCNGVIYVNGRTAPCFSCDDDRLATAVQMCSTCHASRANFGVVRFDIGTDIYYPQFLSLNATNATSTSVVVVANLTLTSSGVLACAAIESYNKVSSVQDITGHSSARTVVISYSAVAAYYLEYITISSLLPDTAYNVYCSTSDLKYHVMPLAESAEFVVSKTTACCRKIVISTSPKQLYDRNSTIAASLRKSLSFAFHLSSRPVEIPATVYIVPDIWRVNCTTLNRITNQTGRPVAVPASFSIAAYTNIVDYSFSVLGPSGCYAMDLVDFSSKSTYQASSIVYFTILKSSAALSPPQLSSATLSSNGLSLNVVYNTPTDLGKHSKLLVASNRSAIAIGTRFYCSSILEFIPLNISQKLLQCSWTSKTSLTVDLSSLTTSMHNVNVRNYVRIVNNSTRADCPSYKNCTNYAYSVDHNGVAVVGPTNPVVPTLVLSAPQSITVCDPLKFDISGSTGNAGRNWTSVQWFVNVSNSHDTTEGAFVHTRYRLHFATRFAEYLNAYFDINKETFLVVPASMLINGSYTITLQASNYFGKSSAASVTVDIRNSTYVFPIVSIVGTTIQTQLRSKGFDLTAQLSYPACAGASSSSRIALSWKAYKIFAYDSTLVSTSKNNRVFRVPALKLDVLTTYHFLLTISSLDPTDDRIMTQTVTVNVGLSGVVASIAGATSRSVQHKSNAIIIDASASYDIDFPTSSVTALNFSWTCMQISPTYGAVCGTNAATFASFTSFSLSLNNSAADNYYFVSDGEYTITVTVANKYGASNTASVELIVVDHPVTSSVPALSIDSTAKRFNAGSRIVLTGEVVSSTAGTVIATWSSTSLSALSSVALSPLTRAITSSSADVVTTFQLSLSPSTLSPGGSYSFTLSAYSQGSSSIVTQASITITTNSPPSGGTLKPSPLSGIELNTTFVLQAVSWIDIDADYPLTFTFSSYNVKLSLDGQLLLVNSYVPSASAQLARGLAALDRVVTLSVSVTDSSGSSSTIQSTVTVYPLPTLSVSSLSSFVSSQLVQSSALLNPAATISTISTAATILNPANCSYASMVSKCAFINRHSCQRTSGTCGPCLTGYFGADGDSNLPCMPQDQLFKNGERCYASYSCFSGQCEALVCVDKIMTCSNNCSRHGTCNLFDTVTGLSRGSFCAATDTSCTAVCECQSGYYGDDCSQSLETLTSSTSLRDSLCSYLVNTLTDLDGSTDSVVSLALAAANVLSVPSQLTAAALTDCATAITYYVEQFPSVFADASASDSGIDSNSENSVTSSISSGYVVHQALSNAMAALNLLLLKNNNNAVSNSYISPSTISVLANNISVAVAQSMFSFQNTLGINDGGKTVVSSGIRASTMLLSTADLTGNITVTAPQSDTESWLDSRTSSIVLNVSGTDTTAFDAIGVTLIHYPGRHLNSEYNSSSIQVHFSLQSSSSSSGTDDGSNTNYVESSIVLQNRDDISYAYFPRSYNLYCTKYSKSSYIEVVECPDPAVAPFDITCGARSTTYTNLSCPEFIQRPDCMSRDPIASTAGNDDVSGTGASAFSLDSNCELVSFTEQNTTCLCKYPLVAPNSSSTGRRKLASSSSSYVAVLSYEFTSSSNAHRAVVDASGLFVYARVYPIWLPTIIGCLTVGCVLLIYGCAHYDSQGESPLTLLKDVSVVHGVLRDSYLPNMHQKLPLFKRITNELIYQQEWIALIRSFFDAQEGCDGYTSDNSGITSRSIRGSVMLLRFMVFLLLLILFFTKVNDNRQEAEDPVFVCVVSALCFLLARVMVDLLNQQIHHFVARHSEVNTLQARMDEDLGFANKKLSKIQHRDDRINSMGGNVETNDNFTHIGPGDASAGTLAAVAPAPETSIFDSRPVMFESSEIRHRVLKAKRSEAKTVPRISQILFNRNFNVAWEFNEFDNWNSREEFAVLNAYCGTQLYGMELIEELGQKVDSVGRGRIGWTLLNLFILDMLPSYCTSIFRCHFQVKSQLEYLLRQGQEPGGGSLRPELDFEHLYYLQLRGLSAANVALIIAVVKLTTEMTSNQQISTVICAAFGLLVDMFMVSTFYVLFSKVLLPLCVRPYVRRLQSILAAAVAAHEADILTYNENYTNGEVGSISLSLTTKEKVEIVVDEKDDEPEKPDKVEDRKPLVTKTCWGRPTGGLLIHDTRQSLSEVPNFVKKANAYIAQGHAIGAANPKLAGKHIRFQLTSMFYTYFNVAQRYRTNVYLSDVLSGFGTVWPKQHLQNNMLVLWHLFPPAHTHAFNANATPQSPSGSNRPPSAGHPAGSGADSSLSLSSFVIPTAPAPVAPAPNTSSHHDDHHAGNHSPGAPRPRTHSNDHTQQTNENPKRSRSLQALRLISLFLRGWSLLPYALADAILATSAWVLALAICLIHVMLYHRAEWTILFPTFVAAIVMLVCYYYPMIDLEAVSEEPIAHHLRESMILPISPLSPQMTMIDMLESNTEKDAKEKALKEAAESKKSAANKKSKKVTPEDDHDGDDEAADRSKRKHRNKHKHDEDENDDSRFHDAPFPMHLSFSVNNSFGFTSDQSRIAPPLQHQHHAQQKPKMAGGSVFPSPKNNKLSPLNDRDWSRDNFVKPDGGNRPGQVVPFGAVKELSVDLLKKSVVPVAPSKQKKPAAKEINSDDEDEQKSSPNPQWKAAKGRHDFVPDEESKDARASPRGVKVPVVPSIVRSVTTDTDLLNNNEMYQYNNRDNDNSPTQWRKDMSNSLNTSINNSMAMDGGGESEESLNSEDEGMLHRVSGFFHDLERGQGPLSPRGAAAAGASVGPSSVKKPNGKKEDGVVDYYSSGKMRALQEDDAVELSSDSDA
jgi:hypothetical protein